MLIWNERPFEIRDVLPDVVFQMFASKVPLTKSQVALLIPRAGLGGHVTFIGLQNVHVCASVTFTKLAMVKRAKRYAKGD